MLSHHYCPHHRFWDFLQFDIASRQLIRAAEHFVQTMSGEACPPSLSLSESGTAQRVCGLHPRTAHNFSMLRGVREKLRQRRARRAASLDTPAEPRPRRHLPWKQPKRAADVPPVVAPGEEIVVRNEDSFSSLPSTHASRDPFLNDDFPVLMSRIEDRPRVREGGRSGSVVLKRRRSLWKRTFVADAELTSTWERELMRAVALSEAAGKRGNVAAARVLVDVVVDQVQGLEDALTVAKGLLEKARGAAAKLPSTRDARYERLLYAPGVAPAKATAKARADAEKAEVERVVKELACAERVWDIEAMLAEKRLPDAVQAVERLRKDHVASSASSRTLAALRSVVEQLAAEIGACCTRGGAQAAKLHAPLLARLGWADKARLITLSSAEAELFSELNHITADASELTPRIVSMVVMKTFSQLCVARAAYAKVAENGTGDFLDWVVTQIDSVYSRYISVTLARELQSDSSVHTLAPIVSAARSAVARVPPVALVEGLAAFFDARILAHLRRDLVRPIADKRDYFVSQAHTYANTIPNAWEVGPYAASTTFAKELEVWADGLEQALVGLGGDFDALVASSLAYPTLQYCATLVECGNKAVAQSRVTDNVQVRTGVQKTLKAMGTSLDLLSARPALATLPYMARVAKILSAGDPEATCDLSAKLSVSLKGYEAEQMEAEKNCHLLSTYEDQDQSHVQQRQPSSVMVHRAFPTPAIPAFGVSVLGDESKYGNRYGVSGVFHHQALEPIAVGLQEQARRVILEQRRVAGGAA